MRITREILFRGKCIDTSKWVYGYFVKYQPRVNKDELISSILSAYACDLYLPVIKVESETVGEYTGLKDKNGTKIFEGDIVDITDDNGEHSELGCGIGDIEFYDGLWYINGEINNSLYDLNNCYYIEVVGNVYDNPELLQKE